ncbi:MotE family protein [Margalitia sp. FSL K6-0131]|uniref:MotE family protein n=1 Tax=Margalitia sp. FSL K6-0131 TaxID=2954604 RepID=UPI0030FCEF6F
MAKEEALLEEEKSGNKFLWFIYVVVIPLLFAIVIALIVTTIAGINVFEKAKELGEKTHILSANNATNRSKADEDKIISLNAEIQNKDTQIENLQKQLDSGDNEKQQLLLEQKRLQQQIASLQKSQAQSTKDFKEIVSSYESMNPKNAAPIILQMKDENAVKILSKLSSEALASILEKMPADRAAKYTEMLGGSSN